MADFKVTASQLNAQAESLQDLNGRFKSAVEQLHPKQVLNRCGKVRQTMLSTPLLQAIKQKWTSSTT